jgi:predicted phage-related endonuclease|nr:MAG TPA: Exonuclease [Caudoviricetes sp.]
MEWLEGNKIKVVPPKRPKKLTATRFATVLGLNPWSTPFEVWCEITRTYQKPFEETIYTAAGKTIEPKQAQFMKKSYFMTNIVTPTDIYGEDYFNRTYGDFFKDEPIFGGMWDYLLFNENKKPVTVLEMKTTKRAEDWAKDIPEYYALQAALYAYLLGVDDVIMVASFLSDKDYKDPAQFIPSAKNTITVPFKVSERYPEFKKLVKKAEKWWKDHVETGISPAFDEKADAEILKELRTNTLNPESDIEALLREGEELKAEIDRLSAPIEPLEKRLKVVTDIIKQHALAQFRDGDKKVSIRGEKYEWNVSRSETSEIDKDGLKADGLLAKYTRAKVSYRITTKAIEEEA